MVMKFHVAQEHLFGNSICFYIKAKPIITKSQKESMKLDFFHLPISVNVRHMKEKKKTLKLLKLQYLNFFAL